MISNVDILLKEKVNSAREKEDDAYLLMSTLNASIDKFVNNIIGMLDRNQG